MNAKYFVLDHRSYRKEIKEISKQRPYIWALILVLAFHIETVYLSGLSRLMVSP